MLNLAWTRTQKSASSYKPRPLKATLPTHNLWLHPLALSQLVACQPLLRPRPLSSHWLLFPPFALNHAPALHWLFFRLSRSVPLCLLLIGSYAHSPTLTEPCRRAAPRALGRRRGQGAPEGHSSRRGFSRSRGGAPPRMRSKSIDLVPETGRPRRRSCCRSSETWDGGWGDTTLGGLRGAGGGRGWTFRNRERRDWGHGLLHLRWCKRLRG